MSDRKKVKHKPKNALHHGGYSRDLILPGENCAELNSFWTEFVETLIRMGRSAIRSFLRLHICNGGRRVWLDLRRSN